MWSELLKYCVVELFFIIILFVCLFLSNILEKRQYIVDFKKIIAKMITAFPQCIVQVSHPGCP